MAVTASSTLAVAARLRFCELPGASPPESPQKPPQQSESLKPAETIKPEPKRAEARQPEAKESPKPETKNEEPKTEAKKDEPKPEPKKTEVKVEPKKEAPKTEERKIADVEALVRACLELKAKVVANKEAGESDEVLLREASELCGKAMTFTGLSAGEFWAKFGGATPKPVTKPTTTRPVETKPTGETKPAGQEKPAMVAKPQSTTTPAAEGSALIEKCVSLKASLTATLSVEQVNVASTTCAKAIAYTKLSPADFFAKYGQGTSSSK